MIKMFIMITTALCFAVFLFGCSHKFVVSYSGQPSCHKFNLKTKQVNKIYVIAFYQQADAKLLWALVPSHEKSFTFRRIASHIIWGKTPKGMREIYPCQANITTELPRNSTVIMYVCYQFDELFAASNRSVFIPYSVDQMGNLKRIQEAIELGPADMDLLLQLKILSY